MAGLIFDKAQIEQTIDAVVARTMRMDMTWDWPCGVAYYGICEAYEVTGKQEYLKLVQDRVDEYIELGLPEWTVNTCSMGHCLITLYEHTGDERYLNIAKSKVDYLENKALRFGDRVLQHTVSVNNDFPEQAWADTLFMAAFFLLRMGVLLKDAALIDDALNQYYWHIKYLQDPATGLYYHGYNNLTGDHMSGIFWGRANAWAAYTMSQVGLRLPECYLYPKFLDVVGSLNDQLAALTAAPHGTRPANSHPCKTCPRQAPCGIQSGRYRQRPAVPGPVPRQSALQLYPADLDAVGRPHLEAGRDRRRQSPL